MEMWFVRRASGSAVSLFSLSTVSFTEVLNSDSIRPPSYARIFLRFNMKYSSLLSPWLMTGSNLILVSFYTLLSFFLFFPLGSSLPSLVRHISTSFPSV